MFGTGLLGFVLMFIKHWQLVRIGGLKTKLHGVLCLYLVILQKVMNAVAIRIPSSSFTMPRAQVGNSEPRFILALKLAISIKQLEYNGNKKQNNYQKCYRPLSNPDLNFGLDLDFLNLEAFVGHAALCPTYLNLEP